MRKIVLTYGLIAGGILAAMMVLTMPLHDRIDSGTAMVIGYTTMVVAFLMVYAGVRTYRDSVAGGRISFGRAFRVGILITALATVCYVATWEVLSRTAYPDFAERYAERALEEARAEGATEEELASKQAEMARFADMYKRPLVRMAFTFLEPLPVGLVLTLVTAGVLSRKRTNEPITG